jgi:hypothetical protein
MVKKNIIGVGILASAFFFFGIGHDAFPAPKGGEKCKLQAPHLRKVI